MKHENELEREARPLWIQRDVCPLRLASERWNSGLCCPMHEMSVRELAQSIETLLFFRTAVP